MRAGHVIGSGCLAIAGCSPAQPQAPTPHVAVQSKPVAPPKLETPARWLLDGPSRHRFVTSVDLGTKGTLYTVGPQRWLVSGSPARWVAAEAMLPSPSAAAFAHDAGVTFVGVDGTVVTTDGPLGRIRASHRSPVVARSASAGRKAVVVVGDDGTVHRSTDLGEHWTPVVVTHEAPVVPISVVLDAEGRGVLTGVLARVWVTADDGATWVPSRDTRLASATRDLERRVRFEGGLVLEGTPPVATKAHTPSREFPPEGAPTAGSGSRLRHLLADGLVVAEKQGKGWTWTLSTPGAGAASPSTPLALAGCDDLAIGSAGGRGEPIEVGCIRQPTVEGAKPTTTFMRTQDGGATWTTGETLELGGSMALEVTVGPGRWLAVSSFGEPRVWIRPQQGGAFVPLRLPWGHHATTILARRPPLAPVALILDDKRRPSVGVLSLEDGRMIPGPPIGPAEVDAKLQLAADGAPLVKVGAADMLAQYTPQQGRLVRLDPDGAIRETHSLPYERGDLALAGGRGIFRTERGLFESADDGRTWTRVASPSDEATPYGVRCAPWGCLLPDAVRVGWDLPEKGSQPATVLPQPTQRLHFDAGGLPMRCTVTGTPDATIKFGSRFAVAAPLGPARMLDGAGGYEAPLVAYVVEETAGTFSRRVVELLPAPKTDASTQISTRVVVDPQGVAGWRASRPRPKKKGETTGPVLVELAWMNASSLQVHRAKIADAGVFPANGRALTVVGPDALLFAPGSADARKVFWIEPTGKSTLLPSKGLIKDPFSPPYALPAGKSRAVVHAFVSYHYQSLEDGVWAGESTYFPSALSDLGSRTGTVRYPSFETDRLELGFQGGALRALVGWAGADDKVPRTFMFAPTSGAFPTPVEELPPLTTPLKACGAKVARTDRLPRRTGWHARRPLLIETAGKAYVLAIANVITGIEDSSLCARAWLVHSSTSDISTAIFADTMNGLTDPASSQAFDNGFSESMIPLRCADAPELAKDPRFAALGIDL